MIYLVFACAFLLGVITWLLLGVCERLDDLIRLAEVERDRPRRN